MEQNDQSGWGPLPEISSTGRCGWPANNPNGDSSINSWGSPQAAQGPGMSTEAPISRWNQETCPSLETSRCNDITDEAMVESEEDSSKYVEDSSRYFAIQMSPEEYKKQTADYTKSALASLLQSPEYRRNYTRCRLCWSVWCEGMYSDSCLECGGFAMQRPCPICSGKCGQVWDREVEMSHDHNEAHWDGSCGLPLEQREAFMMETLMQEATEDTILDALKELST